MNDDVTQEWGRAIPGLPGHGPGSRPGLVAPELYRRELGLEGRPRVGGSVRFQPPDQIPDLELPSRPEPALLVHRVVLHRIGDDGGEERRLLHAEIARVDSEVVPRRLAEPVDARAPLDDVQV